MLTEPEGQQPTPCFMCDEPDEKPVVVNAEEGLYICRSCDAHIQSQVYGKPEAWDYEG